MSWTRMVIRWRAADPENPSPQGADAVPLYGQSSELPEDLTGLSWSPNSTVMLPVLRCAQRAQLPPPMSCTMWLPPRASSMPDRGANPSSSRRITTRVRRVYLTGRSIGRRLDSYQARVGG